MSKYTTNAACPSVVLQISHRLSWSMYFTDDIREKCYCNLDALLIVQVSPVRSHEYLPKSSPPQCCRTDVSFPPHCLGRAKRHWSSVTSMKSSNETPIKTLTGSFISMLPDDIWPSQEPTRQTSSTSKQVMIVCWPAILINSFLQRHTNCYVARSIYYQLSLGPTPLLDNYDVDVLRTSLRRPTTRPTPPSQNFMTPHT